MLRQSLSLVTIGILVGTAVAVLAVRPMSAFLATGTRPTDALNFVVVGAILAVVAALATVAPIRRALRVDPAIALRQE